MSRLALCVITALYLACDASLAQAGSGAPRSNQGEPEWFDLNAPATFYMSLLLPRVAKVCAESQQGFDSHFPPYFEKWMALHTQKLVEGKTVLHSIHAPEGTTADDMLSASLQAQEKHFELPAEFRLPTVNG